METAKQMYQKAQNNNRVSIERRIINATARGENKLIGCDLFEGTVARLRELGYSVEYDPIFRNYDVTWSED